MITIKCDFCAKGIELVAKPINPKKLIPHEYDDGTVEMREVDICGECLSAVARAVAKVFADRYWVKNGR